MEAEFQRRYHLRAAKNTRLMMLLGLIIYQVGALVGGDSWKVALIGFVGPVLGWFLCDVKFFHRHAQTIGPVGYVLFFVLMDAAYSMEKATYASGGVSFLPMMNVFVLYTMMRMFLLPSIVSAVAISVAHVVLLQKAGAGAETIENVVIGLMLAHMVGVFTSYQFERNFRQMFADKEKLTREHAIQERLLENILPRDIGSKLRNHFQDEVIDCPDVIVLSADLANFTAYASRVSAGELVGFLNDIYTEFDGLADRFRMTKIKTMGDAVILASGIHGEPDLKACVLMAVAMRTALQEISAQHGAGVDIRIGIARGAGAAGVVGELRPKFDLWGPVVAEAERMEKQSRNGEINLSSRLRTELSASGPGQDLLRQVDSSPWQILKAAGNA
jgi:class 3 adenylate cyclase